MIRASRSQAKQFIKHLVGEAIWKQLPAFISSITHREKERKNYWPWPLLPAKNKAVGPVCSSLLSTLVWEEKWRRPRNRQSLLQVLKLDLTRKGSWFHFCVGAGWTKLVQSVRILMEDQNLQAFFSVPPIITFHVKVSQSHWRALVENVKIQRDWPVILHFIVLDFVEQSSKRNSRPNWKPQKSKTNQFTRWSGVVSLVLVACWLTNKPSSLKLIPAYTPTN